MIKNSNGAIIPAPDGGDWFVWDGCQACNEQTGNQRIDFSVSGLRQISADACNLGNVKGFSWEIQNVQVLPFVP